MGFSGGKISICLYIVKNFVFLKYFFKNFFGSYSADGVIGSIWSPGETMLDRLPE